MDEDFEGSEEHTDESPEDFSREGEAGFFSAYAENEMGIEDDSEQPSDRAARHEASDDDDTDDSGDADSDGAPRDEEEEDDDDELEGDEDSDDEEDEEEDEEEEPAPKSKRQQDPDDDEDDEPTDDFLEAAERNRLPTRFEDVVQKLPAEARRAARAAFKAQLKEMNRGFTAVQQEATSFRAERKQLQAKLAFSEQHAEDFILEAILKDPTLMDRVNKRLPDDGDERAKRVELLDIEQKRENLEKNVGKKIDVQEQRRARGQHIERLAKRLCAHYNVDYDIVEPRLILRVQQSENRDITDDDVRSEIKALHKKLGTKRIERKAAKQKSWIQQKVAERKRSASSPTSRSRQVSGRVPAPAKAKVSGKQSDLQKQIAASVRRIAPNMAPE